MESKVESIPGLWHWNRNQCFSLLPESESESIPLGFFSAGIRIGISFRKCTRNQNRFRMTGIEHKSGFNHLVGKPESIQLAIQATLKYTIPINSWFNENSIESIQISESSRNRLQVWLTLNTASRNYRGDIKWAHEQLPKHRSQLLWHHNCAHHLSLSCSTKAICGHVDGKLLPTSPPPLSQ